MGNAGMRFPILTQVYTYITWTAPQREKAEIFGEIKQIINSYHSCQRRFYNFVSKGQYSWGHPEYMGNNMDEDIMLT